MSEQAPFTVQNPLAMAEELAHKDRQEAMIRANVEVTNDASMRDFKTVQSHLGKMGRRGEDALYESSIKPAEALTPDHLIELKYAANMADDQTTLHELRDRKANVNVLADILEESQLSPRELASLRLKAMAYEDKDSQLTVQQALATRLGITKKAPIEQVKEFEKLDRLYKLEMPKGPLSEMPVQELQTEPVSETTDTDAIIDAEIVEDGDTVNAGESTPDTAAESVTENVATKSTVEATDWSAPTHSSFRNTQPSQTTADNTTEVDPDDMLTDREYFERQLRADETLRYKDKRIGRKQKLSDAEYEQRIQGELNKLGLTETEPSLSEAYDDPAYEPVSDLSAPALKGRAKRIFARAGVALSNAKYKAGNWINDRENNGEKAAKRQVIVAGVLGVTAVAGIYLATRHGSPSNHDISNHTKPGNPNNDLLTPLPNNYDNNKLLTPLQ